MQEADPTTDPLAGLDLAEWQESLEGRTEPHEVPARVLRALLRAARDARELNELFDIQSTRMDEATKAWRAAHPGNDLVVPDLGALLAWLLQAPRERDEMEQRYETSHRSRVHADTCVLRLEDELAAALSRAEAAEREVSCFAHTLVLEWKAEARKLASLLSLAMADEDDTCAWTKPAENALSQPRIAALLREETT